MSCSCIYEDTQPYVWSGYGGGVSQVVTYMHTHKHMHPLTPLKPNKHLAKSTMRCTKSYIKKIIIKGFNAWWAQIAKAYDKGSAHAYLTGPVPWLCSYVSSIARTRIPNEICFMEKSSMAPLLLGMAARVPPPSSFAPLLINDLVCLIYDPPWQIRVSLSTAPLPPTTSEGTATLHWKY